MMQTTALRRRIPAVIWVAVVTLPTLIAGCGKKAGETQQNSDENAPPMVRMVKKRQQQQSTAQPGGNQ